MNKAKTNYSSGVLGGGCVLTLEAECSPALVLN